MLQVSGFRDYYNHQDFHVTFDSNSSSDGHVLSANHAQLLVQELLAIGAKSQNRAQHWRLNAALRRIGGNDNVKVTIVKNLSIDPRRMKSE